MWVPEGQGGASSQGSGNIRSLPFVTSEKQLSSHRAKGLDFPLAQLLLRFLTSPEI